MDIDSEPIALSNMEVDEVMEEFADIQMGPAEKEVAVEVPRKEARVPKQTKTVVKKTVIQTGDKTIVEEVKTTRTVY